MRIRKSGQVATARKQAHAARSNENTMRNELTRMRIERDKLADALSDIANQDLVKMALDPQWASRVARITLTECGY